jgi:hypothetical protein
MYVGCRQKPCIKRTSFNVLILANCCHFFKSELEVISRERTDQQKTEYDRTEKIEEIRSKVFSLYGVIIVPSYEVLQSQ